MVRVFRAGMVIRAGGCKVDHSQQHGPSRKMISLTTMYSSKHVGQIYACV